MNKERSLHLNAAKSLLVWVQIITQFFFPLIAAFPANAVEQRPENTGEYLPYATTLNSVATTLADNDSDGIKNTAKSMATGKAASTVEEWLNQFGTARVNISVDDNGNWDQSSLDLFTPLYDNKKSVWFTQFGLRAPDGRVTGNIGTGVRTYYVSNWMFGGNVFLDNDFTGENRRIGIGAEAWTNYLKLSANSYIGTTGWHDSRDFDNYYEKPADGFDIRAEGYLPVYPQLGAKVMYEQYYGDKVALFDKDTLQRNPSAITTGLSYTPIPLVSFAADYRQGQDSKHEAKFQVNVRYDIGQNWRAQLDPDNVRALRTLAGSRYDLVERNNQIILQYKKKPDQGVSNLALKALSDNAPADGLTQNTLQVLATNRDNEPVRNAPIEWTSTGAAQFSSQMSVTNNDGIATALLTNTSPEVVQVTAKSGSVIASLASRFSEVVVSNVVLKLTKDNSIADGKSANTAVATVTDINNRPIPNSKLSWSATAPATLLNPEMVTDVNGQARTQLTSTVAGDFNLKINAGELSAEQTAHFTADNADAQITDFAVITNNSPANGSAQNTALVTVKDPAGNPVSGVNVELSADKATVSFASAAARAVALQTDNNGQLRVAFSDTVAETVAVTAKLANGSNKAISAVFSADSTTSQIRTVTISKNNSAANGTTPNTAEVQVTDANGNAISGAAIIWSADKATVSFASSANTDANGKSAVSFTDTIAETVTVTAMLANGSSGTASALFIPDNATAQLQGLLVTKDGSAANGTAANTAEVFVTDGTGNPVPNLTVTWSADKTGITFTPGGPTDANGRATVSYVSTIAQSFQLTATLPNGNNAAVASLFIADTASEQISSFDVTSGAIADGTATNAASVLVTDASGNPVSNVAVTWAVSGSAVLASSSGTTDSTGKLTVTLTNQKAEQVNVTATLANGASQTKATQFIANANTARISNFVVTTGALANGSATNTGTVTVTDANNNLLSGITVNWGITGSATLAATSGVTDANGSATVAVTNTKAESVTLTTTVAGVSQGLPMAFQPDLSTVKIDSMSVTTGALANGSATNSGTVTVTDGAGNPVSGVTVNWSTTGSANLSSATSTTNTSGEANITLTSIVAESVTLTASVNNSSETRPTAFIADASTAVITGIGIPVDQAHADGVDQNQVRVTVADGRGNPLEGQTVSWEVSSTDVTIPATGTTDATGTNTVNLTSSTPGLFTVTARLSNGNLRTIQSTFIIAAQILPANITITSDNAVADGSSTNSIQVKVTDGLNAPVQGQTVSFTATNGASITATSGVTGADGIATATAVSNNAGPSTVTASLSNGSSASVNMNFAILYLNFSSLDVNDATYSVSDGFPSTGFIGAEFRPVIDGMSGTDFNWNVTASWAQVNAAGSVTFTGQGTSETVTVTANPISGQGPSYKYQFSIGTWFVQGVNDLLDRADVIAACDAKSLPIPTLRELTSSPAPFTSGPRQPRGPLIDEWGRLINFNTPIFYNWIYVQEPSTNVRSDDGYYRTDDSGSSLSRPVCVIHF